VREVLHLLGEVVAGVVEDEATPGVTAAVSHLPYSELDGLRAHHARLPHLVAAHALEAVLPSLGVGMVA
jgi:hypothetical protein